MVQPSMFPCQRHRPDDRYEQAVTTWGRQAQRRALALIDPSRPSPEGRQIPSAGKMLAPQDSHPRLPPA